MEQELVQRACRGDQRAFQQIVEMYGQLAWRTAYILLPDLGMIDDALQEAWLDVWRGLVTFHPNHALRPWLLAIVAHRCQKVARQRHVPALSLEVAALADFVSGDATEAHALQRERDAELHAALTALSPDQLRIVALHFFADLTLSDIAVVTNLPLGTVKSRLHRALQLLRSRLHPPHPFALEELR